VGRNMEVLLLLWLGWWGILSFPELGNEFNKVVRTLAITAISGALLVDVGLGICSHFLVWCVVLVP